MKKSITLLITLISVLAGCSQKPQSVEEYLAAAQKKYDEGNYYDARQLLAEAIKLEPTGKEIIYQLGRNYAAEHMYDSAFANLSRADKLYPNDRNINTLLSEVSVKTEHWDAAIQALLSLSRTGDPIESHYKELAEYARLGKIGNVEDYYYGKLIEIEPDSMNYYIYQADGALIMEQPQKSLEIISAALKRFGDNPRLLYELGKYYSINGNLGEAENTFRILVAKDSSAFNQLQLATALAYQSDRSKKEEAYAMFKNLRDRTPDKSRVDSIIVELEMALKQKPNK